MHGEGGTRVQQEQQRPAPLRCQIDVDAVRLLRPFEGQLGDHRCGIGLRRRHGPSRRSPPQQARGRRERSPGRRHRIGTHLFHTPGAIRLTRRNCTSVFGESAALERPLPNAWLHAALLHPRRATSLAPRPIRLLGPRLCHEPRLRPDRPGRDAPATEIDRARPERAPRTQVPQWRHHPSFCHCRLYPDERPAGARSDRPVSASLPVGPAATGRQSLLLHPYRLGILARYRGRGFSGRAAGRANHPRPPDQGVPRHGDRPADRRGGVRAVGADGRVRFPGRHLSVGRDVFRHTAAVAGGQTVGPVVPGG